MTRWQQIAAFCAIGLLVLLGLITLIGGVLHLYQDHLWDDQIRAIQRQQLTQPKPAIPAEK